MRVCCAANASRNARRTVLCNSGIDNSGSAERLICQMAEEVGIQRSDIRYIMATGYSRKGIEIADDDVSEITAHAYGVRLTAPPEFTPGLIVDIGGQDSKIIYLDKHFNVKNFNMNDKCAAGTGKFMEVSAQILETTIDQIGPLSLQSKAPCDINSMCVVFAQSEIISLIARKYAFPTSVSQTKTSCSPKFPGTGHFHGYKVFQTSGSQCCSMMGLTHFSGLKSPRYRTNASPW